MHVAGPISNPEEAQALEQAAYLTDLRTRLAPALRHRTAASVLPRLPSRPSR